MMKAFILFLLPIASFASGLDEHLAKMRGVIEKDGRAIFCVAQVPIGDRKDQSVFWPKAAYCVGDVTIGVGMAEKSGCAAFVLNTYTLKTSGIGSYGRQRIVEGKNCDQGFEKLMGLNLHGYVDEPAGKDDLPLGWLFYDGARVEWVKPVVVFEKKSGLAILIESKSKYLQWFENKRKEIQEKKGK